MRSGPPRLRPVQALAGASEALGTAGRPAAWTLQGSGRARPRRGGSAVFVAVALLGQPLEGQPCGPPDKGAQGKAANP